MAQPDDTGLFIKVGEYIAQITVAIVGTIIAVLFNRVVQKHDDEIKSIKDGLKGIGEKIGGYVTIETYEQNRRERREAELGLHHKIDSAASDIHRKIEQGQAQTTQRLDMIMNELLRRRTAARNTDSER